MESSGESAAARVEYDLQTHAALIRTMLAVIQTELARTGDEHPAHDALEAELEDVQGRLADLPESPLRPMGALASRLGWSAEQVGFVWTTVALAANPRMLVHARALDDIAAKGLSASLYTRIAGLDPDGARAFGLAMYTPSAPPRSGLLVRATGEWSPASVPWLPAPELVRYLAELPSEDVTLSQVEPPTVGLILDADQTARLQELEAVLSRSRPVVVYLDGPELSGRRTAVAVAAGRLALTLDLARVAPGVAGFADALVELRREAALRGAVPVIAGIETLMGRDGNDDPRLRLLANHVDECTRPIVLISAWRGLDVGARLPAVRLEWMTPDVAARRRLWIALSEADGNAHADAFTDLAMRYPIGAGVIGRAVASARVLADAEGGGALGATHLVAGVRQNIAERMGGLAERIAVKQSWDDLVLSDDLMAQVRALVGRVKHAHLVFESWGYRTKMPRGQGVAALFSGAPGTGKTMVAGLIARELGLDLYQVDLSKVVSKWVGETEKQLAKVFDAAEAGHVLLLFDEADALFGQRSQEMKGANDRYANLEVNFLLQRVESFNGTVILTTNLDASIDKALKRRLAAHVVFQAPDDDERARLWERLLASEGAPLDRDIDATRLASMFPKMTGANIRNAALSAAFLAAAEQRPRIDSATVIQAARNEYLAMGHVLAASARM